MSEKLIEHIRKYIELSEQEALQIISFFKKRISKKKENLLIAGKHCTDNYFVVNGCLRMYFINDKGVEQTIQFAIENWWLSDYSCYESKKYSEYYIQAVEKSELMVLDYQSQEEMLMLIPKMERYFRKIHQRAHGASQFRIRCQYDLSREELYRHFMSLYPEFVQRIPQYLLASYLGFTPEYLSEIRAKKLS